MTNNVTVAGEFGVKPTLTFPATPAPTELQVSVLHEGDGEVVEAGDKLVCHYFGQVWDGPVFDTSFDRGQTVGFPIGVGAVIQGWDQGLVGQRVGSRVLLVIPADLAYGARGIPQAGIPGGATLVFVTDIVGVE